MHHYPHHHVVRAAPGLRRRPGLPLELLPLVMTLTGALVLVLLAWAGASWAMFEAGRLYHG